MHIDKMQYRKSTTLSLLDSSQSQKKTKCIPEFYSFILLTIVVGYFRGAIEKERRESYGRVKNANRRRGSGSTRHESESRTRFKKNRCA